MEAAYDGLMEQSLLQRRAVEVVSSSIWHADVKPVKMAQGALPASVETPSARDLGIEAEVSSWSCSHVITPLTYQNCFSLYSLDYTSNDQFSYVSCVTGQMGYAKGFD
ncbi:hypothetical protein HanPI659440_Chr15g0592761 [Helianthus annuus]|nr:hypothetical protein HanPI659440_Chr15g0592761 [Helianthus annuus]